MFNIDKLIGEQKIIFFGGKEYPVTEPTLEIVLKADKLLLASKDEDGELSAMANVIKSLVPGIDVSKIPVRVLAPMFQYLMGDGEKAEDDDLKNENGRLKAAEEVTI